MRRAERFPMRRRPGIKRREKTPDVVVLKARYAGRFVTVSRGDIRGGWTVSQSLLEAHQEARSRSYIVDSVTILDRGKLDLGVTVFAAVKTNQHHETWLAEFAQAISPIPEVIELHRMSGDVDYLVEDRLQGPAD